MLGIRGGIIRLVALRSEECFRSLYLTSDEAQESWKQEDSQTFRTVGAQDQNALDIPGAARAADEADEAGIFTRITLRKLLIRCREICDHLGTASNHKMVWRERT